MRVVPTYQLLLQVRLKEYGSELVEIADNGSGVEPANYQTLTLKYHTSKLQHFADLQASSQAQPITQPL